MAKRLQPQRCRDASRHLVAPIGVCLMISFPFPLFCSNFHSFKDPFFGKNVFPSKERVMNQLHVVFVSLNSGASQEYQQTWVKFVDVMYSTALQVLRGCLAKFHCEREICIQNLELRL